MSGFDRRGQGARRRGGRRLGLIAGLAGLLWASAAAAAPGLGDEVYGAEARRGETELEARYQRLGGRQADGEDMLKLEATHHVSDRLRLAAFGEFGRDPGGARRADEAGIEAIYTLGRAAGFTFALYGEYALGFHGQADALETKLIVERRRGPLDLRLNLVAGKPLAVHAPVELSYAAAADYAVTDELRLGVEGFGELGSFERFAPRAEHYAGPRAAIEIEGLGPELELNAGYLFPLGAARDEARGQLRLGLEMEF